MTYNRATIYDQHGKAFASVGVFVVLHHGEHVANISIKHPKDGASRLWAYVHWLGTPMVRGYANGFGYDKRSAAVSSAVGKMMEKGRPECWTTPEGVPAAYVDFCRVLFKDDGAYFYDRLRNAGFTVIQVV